MPALRLTLCPPHAVTQVQKVTIAPHQKLPLGHMILDLNEGRELTGLFTRRYLLQQLRLVLAGEPAALSVHLHCSLCLHGVNHLLLDFQSNTYNAMVARNFQPKLDGSTAIGLSACICGTI